MASEVKQTIKTLYQNYHKALSEKQATFNLSDKQIKEIELEVYLSMQYSQDKTKQIIKGTYNDIYNLLTALDTEVIHNKDVSIDINEIKIIL